MPFFYCERRDLAIAQIPKAGIQTMNEWLGPEFHVVSNEAARIASRRVAFIRHPIERAKSCFRFFYWLADMGQQHAGGASKTWDEFVDRLLAPNTIVNEHWQRQVEHIGDVPNIYRRFERLTEHMDEFVPGILPHNNRTSPLPTPDYRLAELLAYYADDLRLWEAAP